MNWEEESVIFSSDDHDEEDEDDSDEDYSDDIQHVLLESIRNGDSSSLFDVIKCKNEIVLVEILKDESISISKKMINYQDERQQSCLHWAVSTESHSWVKFLLEKVTK